MMARCPAGAVMMLALDVSKRICPELDCHIREGDCTGGAPPAGCVVVVQSEQEGGGVGGWEETCTGPQFITRAT